MENCFLLMCGLPASGKTLLVNDMVISKRAKYEKANIEISHRPETHLDSYCVILVSYDNLIPLEIQGELVKRQDEEWKQIRKDIIAASEIFLGKIMKNENTKDVSENPYVEKLHIANPHATAFDKKPKNLVVIEDNLYYSSMRYSWYQLARKFSSGFCQVWLECPVPVLKTRNSQRQQKVPPEVIEIMSEKKEPPDSAKNSWERYSLILDTVNTSRTDLLMQVMDLVNTAASNPTKPVEILEHEVLAPTTAYMVDQILRKIVSGAIEGAKGTGIELAPYAKQMNSRRVSILERMKQGLLIIPTEKESNEQRLKKFITDIFYKEEVIL